MEIRWGLDELPGLLDELEIRDPLLVTSERWRDLDVPVARRFTGVRSHTPADTVRATIEAAGGADGLVALGGGSAIDTAKAASAETELRVVSVPTTYSGAEWATSFGMRDERQRRKGGGGGARLAGVVYDPKLTLELPRSETVGTAMNALMHCAEALYVRTRSDRGDRHATTGATALAYALPLVVDDPASVYVRTRLFEGAMRAGMALAEAGLALGHAMAQALGGRYGVPHGAMNAICLPLALRFNAEVASDAIRRFGDAMGTDDPAARARELARLGGFEQLRDFGIPANELREVAEAAAVRPGARANPRAASPDEIEALLRSAW